MHNYYYLNRGEDYRPEFSKIGEIRSILPKHVNVMALTATATVLLREHVVKTIGMIDPAVVEVSPEKDNLYFSVSEFQSINVSFQPLMTEIKIKRTQMERTLIRPLDCTNLWISFCKFLGPDITEPPGKPLQIPELRLVDCYTGCTQESVRNIILKQYFTASCLRVLIATIAFGLGVNCPDIRRVIHFGVPEDIETYVQQVGRAGRDGKFSYCLMLYGTGVYKRYCNHKIKEYCTMKDKCRRHFIYSQFGSYSFNETLYHTCLCCDVCSCECSCISCKCN